MTKKELEAKLAERRKVLSESKKKERALDVRKSLQERAKARQSLAKRRAVIKETVTRREGSPRTITEDINLRNRRLPKEQHLLYTTLAENMANAYKSMSSFNEATQAGSYIPGAVANAAGVGLMKTYFDIFYGYFPNLIATEIASTQPIKTQEAVVFYYQSVAGSTKGNVTAGDVLIDPFQVNTDINYTSPIVNLPKVELTGAYSTGTLASWGPVVAKSVLIESADLVWSTDTAFTGTLHDGDTDIAITGGTVTVGDGTVSVAFTLGAGPSKAYGVTYEYENRYAPTEVPELNANVLTKNISAKARTIKTNSSFQAGFGFEAQFGKPLQDVLAEQAMYELKRETDLDFVFEVMRSAPVMAVWNQNAGIAQGLYEMHKKSFRDAVVKASNYIFQKSKRVRGNVLIVGINAQTIVETLDEFKGSDYGSQIGGPAVIGKLMDIKVIAVPDLGDNDWAVIYKNSKDNLDAGIIFAPYIPVMATNPVMLDDFLVRRAYTCSYGKLVVNANYFVRGTIINDPMASPIYLVSEDGTSTGLGVIGEDAIVPAIPGTIA